MCNESRNCIIFALYFIHALNLWCLQSDYPFRASIVQICILRSCRSRAHPFVNRCAESYVRRLAQHPMQSWTAAAIPYHYRQITI